MSCNSIASWYIRIYMHVCMHKNVYTYVYIRIYTHIHIRPEQKSLVAHQLGMARRGAARTSWGEMPDAARALAAARARAAALSRRAYEAATGRGLGGVGTVSPVKPF
jgi:hypothetical protein